MLSDSHEPNTNLCQNEKRKAKVVSNFEKLNNNLNFDGYFVPNNDLLARYRMLHKFYDTWILASHTKKLRVKVVTTFSTPTRIIPTESNVFWICNVPQVFQRKWRYLYETLAVLFSLY